MAGQGNDYKLRIPGNRMPIDIPAMLRDLARIVDQIAETLEWGRLARQERGRAFATSFDLDLHLAEELRDLNICFADADFSLRELLRRFDPERSESQRQQWLHELDRLEDRVRALSAGAKLKNP
jgi:hypothetical protein